MPDDSDQQMPDLPPEFGENLVQQVFDLWLTPEIARRENLTASPQVELIAAQVIFHIGSPPEVRFNQEVKAIMIVRDSPDQSGLQEVIGIHLTDADPDAGHITLLRVAETWQVGFSCLYNRSKARTLAASAANYLKLAEAALNDRFFRGFVDTLHSATELAAKARLMLMPMAQFLTFKRHGHVQAEFNKFGRPLDGHRNIPEPYLDLLNTLGRLRSEAKYSLEPFTLDPVEAQQMLTTAVEMVRMVQDLTWRPEIS